jgi:hypothetical protein
MSWHFSQAAVEAFSAASCSDGERFAPLKSSDMPEAYSWHDKTTESLSLFQFGMTSDPSTADPGPELLMWCQLASHARTSPSADEAPVSPESAADYGLKQRELFAKWNPVTSSWKILQPSPAAGSESSSVTWPRWGMMRDGECWELSTPALHTNASGSGLWPTPNSRDWKDTGPSQGNRKSPNLGTAVHARGAATSSTSSPSENTDAQTATQKGLLWPTPVSKSDSGGRIGLDGGARARDLIRRNHGDQAVSDMTGGKLNPTWVEWLMGWPLGWTDLRPLAMDSVRKWWRSHGKFYT